jgi:hypothetical protein
MNLGFSMSSSQCLILLIAAYKAYLSYSQATTPLVGSDVSLHWFKNKAEIRLPGELRVVNEGENDVPVRTVSMRALIIIYGRADP